MAQVIIFLPLTRETQNELLASSLPSLSHCKHEGCEPAEGSVPFLALDYFLILEKLTQPQTTCFSPCMYVSAQLWV